MKVWEYMSNDRDSGRQWRRNEKSQPPDCIDGDYFLFFMFAAANSIAVQLKREKPITYVVHM